MAALFAERTGHADLKAFSRLPKRRAIETPRAGDER
jgi:hypothetical protein